jgi:hypothetical protein
VKLRIKGNSIRLRLTKSEVDALREHGVVEESVYFSAMSRFTYALERGGDAVIASFEEGRVVVRVPNALAVEWCDTDRVGIDESAGDVRVLIEKDWQCLAPRDEDESDAFPHPRAK